jgi:putative membrane protein
MKKYILLSLKGALMGAANVIPGVSGGTVALLTGIFEPLIQALRSFDLAALRLLKEKRFKELAAHIDLYFLMAVGSGILVSILTFARLLEYFFDHYALYVWAFFFGLILASVYFVWKQIKKITGPVLILFALGTAIAAGIAFLRPAEENASYLYLFICGIVAMCSMILPGLSGSYVLLLMGNYQLVMIESVVHLRLSVLLPVAAGAAIGLLAFARFLGWIFNRFHDGTTALLTGFVFGSLSIIWPWKTALMQTFEVAGKVKEKVIGYEYSLPDWSGETGIALAFMAAGLIILALVEKTAAGRSR